MRKILVIVILLISFLNHCNSEKNTSVKERKVKDIKENANVRFEKINTVEITGINYPSMYFDGESLGVYGLGAKADQNWSGKKYDLNLNYKNDLNLSFGQGPGDLSDGGVFYSNGKEVYFHDNILRRISVFDKNLNFISVKKINPSYPVTFIKDGEYFIATRTNYECGKKRCFNFYVVSFPRLRKKKFYELGPYLDRDEKFRYVIGAVPRFQFFYRKNKIYFLNMQSYQILTFSIKGEILDKLKVGVEKIKLTERQQKQWLKHYYPRYYSRWVLGDKAQPASWMIPLKKGFVVVRRNYDTIMYTNKFAKGDYFDYQLNLKGKVSLPCFYQIFALRAAGYSPRVYHYHKGFLFLINEINEDFFLEKWRVIE